MWLRILITALNSIGHYSAPFLKSPSFVSPPLRKPEGRGRMQEQGEVKGEDCTFVLGGKWVFLSWKCLKSLSRNWEGRCTRALLKAAMGESWSSSPNVPECSVRSGYQLPKERSHISCIYLGVVVYYTISRPRKREWIERSEFSGVDTHNWGWRKKDEYRARKACLELRNDWEVPATASPEHTVVERERGWDFKDVNKSIS